MRPPASDCVWFLRNGNLFHGMPAWSGLPETAPLATVVTYLGHFADVFAVILACTNALRHRGPRRSIPAIQYRVELACDAGDVYRKPI